jgi:hypothetical protein
MYGVTGKDHPCSIKDQCGSKNPNHDGRIYIFENINTGEQYTMTRFEFKELGLIHKSGIDRITTGALKHYKGWKLA